ncbi:2-aminophenol 1,6-dioxygenase subunit beta [Sporotomaculum syntrophicum]|uniref:2-aminophenol 1,6-dioxygenase subunit beta n=2 Tax=Sporotomaculum syntrophicum TaxID=182264 RepID=A0A9D3AYU8_9FIRM|nr:2-aminophenol 1,6-dioxygenase subunit beta [Sporotomaculum syntrophicum]
MVPEVGQGRDNEVANTKKAMLELGRRLSESDAETLVMISPHGTVFSDGIGINAEKELSGNLGQFNAPGVRFALANDLALVQKIQNKARLQNITVAGIDSTLARRYGVTTGLDHGIMAPLYFLRQAGVHIPLVHVSMGLLPFYQLYSFGVALREAAGELNKHVAVLASSDLSHRLTLDAPNGYHPAGKEFDHRLVKLVRVGDVEGICGLDPELAEQAGECGLRSIIMMLGALDGVEITSEVLSYEGPFGVGYLVASLVPGARDEQRRLQDKIRRLVLDRAGQKRTAESYPVQLARRVLENYYHGGRDEFKPQEVPEEFAGRRAGVFVSLKKHGRLRGCIGTIAPTKNNIAEEIAENAVSAAIRDPRFYPVKPEELPELDISVDILGEPEPVHGLDELDPHKYGVIVSAGGRRGLLLPDLEGIDTVDEQVAIARQKAGISPGEKVRLERFEVVRYH